MVLSEEVNLAVVVEILLGDLFLLSIVIFIYCLFVIAYYAFHFSEWRHISCVSLFFFLCFLLFFIVLNACRGGFGGHGWS